MKSFSGRCGIGCEHSIFIRTVSSYVTIMCRKDELSLTMSWVGCLLKDSELFTLFVENSQIILKISAIPILLTFMNLGALNLMVNNQLNSSPNSSSLRQNSGTHELNTFSQTLIFSLLNEKPQNVWIIMCFCIIFLAFYSYLSEELLTLSESEND